MKSKTRSCPSGSDGLKRLSFSQPTHRYQDVFLCRRRDDVGFSTPCRHRRTITTSSAKTPNPGVFLYAANLQLVYRGLLHIRACPAVHLRSDSRADGLQDVLGRAPYLRVDVHPAAVGNGGPPGSPDSRRRAGMSGSSERHCCSSWDGAWPAAPRCRSTRSSDGPTASSSASSNPEYIEAGDRKILCSGFWGLSRHMNYGGEGFISLGMALSVRLLHEPVGLDLLHLRHHHVHHP